MQRFKILMIIIILSVMIYPAPYRVYLLGSQYSRKYNGIGHDSYGNIYIGAGDTWGYNGAALFKYDVNLDSLIIVGNVKQASVAAKNWLNGDTPGKIHTNIYEGPDGNIWFGTHSASEGVDYSGFRGGHIYRFDPSLSVLTDESAPDVAIPNQGLLAIAPAFSCSTIYSVGYPDGDIWKYDLKTRKSSFLMKSNTRLGGISRNFFTDNKGKMYYPMNICFICFDPTDSTRTVKGRGMSGVTQISSILFTPDKDTAYFINHGTYHLWRYIPSIDSVKDLGVANIDNDTFSIGNLAARWDLQCLYYAPSKSGTIIEYNLKASTKKNFMTIPSVTLTGSDGTDRDGNLWFSSYGQYDDRVYKFYHNIPCSTCGTKNEISNNSNNQIVPKLRVLPNPAIDHISVILNNLGGTFNDIRIYNSLGICVLTLSNNTNMSINIPVLKFTPGVYYLTVHNNKLSLNSRFVVFR
ncbi:MAG: T9SS type A sorting domain-containing protein [Fibrobacteres bacterium]|nr:T9SS type A sorting domain-containing protein [Fibrobacterota bacterium]